MLTIKNHFEEFISDAKRKTVVAFGMSDFLRLISQNYKELDLGRNIEWVADSDVRKQGRTIEVAGVRKDIFSPDRILEYGEGQVAVLISSDVYAYDIYAQLDRMLQGKDMDVFVLPMMVSAHVDGVTDMNLLKMAQGQEERIPRIIHYFWFSGETKTGLAMECIESWKRACPDYEIREWNAGNYDVSGNAFAYGAYKQKKWAYVTDYARLDVVYRYGGIYLDLDVRLHKGMEALLRHDFFVGFGPLRDVEAAAFGAVAGCPLVKGMLGIYEGRDFNPDEDMRLQNLQPALLDRFFAREGFRIDGSYQERDGAAIYPRDVFSGKNWFTGEYEFTEAAIGVHECAGGWGGKDGGRSRRSRKEGMERLQEIYKCQQQKEGVEGCGR